MKKSVRMRIEDELRNYHATRRRYIDLRNEMCFDKDGMACFGRSNLPGKPTESTAIKLVSSAALLNMGRWVSAIENTVIRLDKTQYRLVELRYWAAPRSLTDDGIAMELGISRRTYFYWVNGILANIDRLAGESFDKL